MNQPAQQTAEAAAKPSPPAASMAQTMYLVGFLTIGSQILLVREIFTALYGSDIAIAFVMASWTLFTGIGACALGRLLARSRVNPRCGQALYCALIVLVFLALRRWGAESLITLPQYLFIPVFLCMPCLLGGALFSWVVARYADTTPQATATAYADETMGGLTAGLAIPAYTHLGGTATPALLCFLSAATLLAVFSRFCLRKRVRLPLLAGAILAAALVLPFEAVERRALSLHYPRYRVLDHRDTPYCSLTAAARDEHVVVFENGLPLPSSVVTPSREALAALITVFPRHWRNVLAVGSTGAGMSEVLGRFRNARVLFHERDAGKIRFLHKWYRSPALHEQPMRTSRTPWQTANKTSERWDLIALFASQPGSLQGNQQLTREFFRQARRQLAADGALVVILPTAPGFVHPLQQRYLTSVLSALEHEFVSTLRVTTDLGCCLLVGTADNASRPQPIDVVTRRYEAPEPDTLAEVAEILSRMQGESLLLADRAAPVRDQPNSVMHPVAYFSYLHFRGEMVDGVPAVFGLVCRPQPLWLGCLFAVSLLVLTWPAERRLPGSRPLFWSSWIATMTVMFSIYLHQSVVGQAFWLAAALIAGSMGGICLGARRGRSRAVPTWGPLTGLVLPALFLGYRLLSSLNAWVLLALLVAANVFVGQHLGRRFAWAGSHADPERGRGAGWLFFMDLLGATGGFLVGGVLLPWWIGFRTSSVLCAGLAVVAQIPSAVGALRSVSGQAG